MIFDVLNDAISFAVRNHNVLFQSNWDTSDRTVKYREKFWGFAEWSWYNRQHSRLYLTSRTTSASASVKLSLMIYGSTALGSFMSSCACRISVAHRLGAPSCRCIDTFYPARAHSSLTYSIRSATTLLCRAEWRRSSCKTAMSSTSSSCSSFCTLTPLIFSLLVKQLAQQSLVWAQVRRAGLTRLIVVKAVSLTDRRQRLLSITTPGRKQNQRKARLQTSNRTGTPSL